MKRPTINLITLILIFTSCSTTKKAVNNKESKSEIWTEKSTVQKAVEFEKSLSSEYEILEQNVSLSKSVFPLLEEYQIAKPFIVKRKQTGFLPIYAEYFYSEQDSILRYVSYDWEKDRYGNFFKKQEIWKEESTKMDKYNQEYEKIKAELILKFGQPREQDAIPQTTESTSGRGDYLSRNTVWETEEFYAELNMIFESMTYRIRLNYYWKK
jgi:hypothetical protein